MNKQILNIELYGSIGYNSSGELLPEDGDTVVRIRRNGRLQFITVEWRYGILVNYYTKEVLNLNECYLLYSSDIQSVGDIDFNNFKSFGSSSKPIC